MGFFDCLFEKGKLPKKKKYCDLFYPYDGKAPNSVDGLKVLNERYDCYQEYLNISRDRDFCDLSYSNETDFYKCLNEYNINDKPDYCIWKEMKRKFENKTDTGCFLHFGGGKNYEDCL